MEYEIFKRKNYDSTQDKLKYITYFGKITYQSCHFL